MSVPVGWTCTEIPPRDPGDGRNAESRPLEAFRGVSAYVLLGDPGAGKTSAFKTEHEVLRSKGHYVSARDFLTLEPRDHPEWGSKSNRKTLFIDGLDEARAGSEDVRTPFDRIRGKLDALGKPPFRLSCREADWLGAHDRTHLETVSPDSRVTVLRLNPLGDEDIERILQAHHVVDTGNFLRAARQHGVEGFLSNPQTLVLLAKVVGEDGSAGNWPASRLELFERACRRIVQEENPEHRAASQSSAGTAWPSVENLLNAAGRLCAVQLLAGVTGFAMTDDAEHEDFPQVDEPAGEDGQLLRTALGRKLFNAHSSGRFAPIHHHVAAFLGARYLAGQTEGGTESTHNGLPVRRVTALMTGCDGMVVTPLRGLSAWLAAQCPSARAILIERDPIGVGLYGDVGPFSTDERHALLTALQIQGPRLVPAQRTAPAFRTLATPEMAETLRRMLADSSRTHEHQTFVHFLVCLLAHGTPLPALADIVLCVVRDETLLADMKAAALDAFIHNAPDAHETTRQLEALLADVRAGDIADPHDELLGTLLRQLHPDELAPAEVWTYLSESSNPLWGGRYYRFWKRLPDQSTDSAVADHLNVLVARQDTVWPALKSRGLQDLPARLLIRGLEAHGDRIERGRLYDWLGAGMNSDLDRPPEDCLELLRGWLGARPAIQKAILLEGLERLEGLDDDKFRREVGEIEQLLYGTDPPANFDHWCLERAETAKEERVAEYWLLRVRNAVRAGTNSRGLSLDLLERRVKKHDVLAEIYAHLQERDQATDAAAQRFHERARRYAAQKERQRQRNVDHVRAHEAALRENRCRPDLLNELAAAYMGLRTDAEGNTPVERLRNLFGDDEGLTQAALTGLRSAILRDDLPDLDEIVRLREQNHEHNLALPVLVSLEELNSPDPASFNKLARAVPDGLDRLDLDRIRTALGFHYCTLGLSEPGWFASILDSRPELVADVLIRTAAMEIRNGREHVPGLYDLACDPRHAEVARMASLPLLRGFTIRCAARQMTDLSRLLWSALQHADQDVLLDLIEHKLTRPSMDPAQRGRWLAAGLVLSPERYLQRSEEFATGSETHTRHLFAFFSEQPLQAFPMARLRPSVLQLIVRLTGHTFRPWGDNWSGGVIEITPDMSAAERVQWMIQSLSERPTVEASAALEALASDEALSPWCAELTWARVNQQVIRRDATYRHPDVEQVCRTLSGGRPANAGDLAALVVDRLDEIADRIKNASTNDWRSYWNENSHGRPTEPKPENSCRDALLRDLRRRLPPGTEAQPEAQYVNEKRADIRVSGADFNVPLEIKKNGHPALWSALRDQLIGRYVRDPETDGYGIYLVLWFGETEGNRTPLPPEDPRPAGPAALRTRLEALLTPEAARKIAIRVIDVTP